MPLKNYLLLNTTASTDVFKNNKYRARLGNMPIPQMCHSLPLRRGPGGKHITHRWVPPDQKPSISVPKCCPFPGWSKPASVTLQCQRFPPRGRLPQESSYSCSTFKVPRQPWTNSGPCGYPAQPAQRERKPRASWTGHPLPSP